MRRIALLLLLLAPAATVAAPFTPTSTPVSPDGKRATVDLPVSQHMRNSVGTDRLGLCVFTSAEHAAKWQNILDLIGYQRWMERRPGGGYPSKVDATLKSYCQEKGIPVPEYVQHTGGDDGFLDTAMKTGRCVCVTYAGSDDFYRGGIDHMVNLMYLDATAAAILDNNRPGKWVWMSRSDFLARWRARGGGWAFVFLSSPPPPHATEPINAVLCDCDPCECPDCPECGCESCKCPKPKYVAGQRCGPSGWGVPSGPVGPFVVPFAQPVAPIRRSEWTKEGEYYRRHDGVYYPAGDLWIPYANGRYGQWGPVPEGVDPPGRTTVADEEPITGVIPGRIHEAPAYSRTGEPCTKEEAHAAMRGGLVDDSGRWFVAIVGDKTFAERVKADLAKLPGSVRELFHVCTFTPESWQVAHFKLSPGVTIRKPSGTSRVAEQTAFIPHAEYTAEKLNATCPHRQPPPSDPTKPNDEGKDDPKTPTKLPTWLVILAGAVAFYFFRKRNQQ